MPFRTLTYAVSRSRISSTKFANLSSAFAAHACRMGGDYIFTLSKKGLGASTRLSVLPCGIVSEPSSEEAWMLIALGFTLGGSSNSPSYNHLLLNGGAEITRFINNVQSRTYASGLGADLMVISEASRCARIDIGKVCTLIDVVIVCGCGQFLHLPLVENAFCRLLLRI